MCSCKSARTSNAMKQNPHFTGLSPSLGWGALESLYPGGSPIALVTHCRPFSPTGFSKTLPCNKESTGISEIKTRSVQSLYTCYGDASTTLTLAYISTIVNYQTWLAVPVSMPYGPLTSYSPQSGLIG